MENKKLVNVPRSVEDPYYRYKMPILRLKVEGRGKMIKTVIVNLEDVATKLERPADHILHFFSFECGAPISTTQNKFVVGGERSVEELSKMLDTYIDKYILCSKCSNPETIMSVKKGQISLSCRACGVQTIVNFPHKMTEYIIKKQVPEKAGKKSQANKAEQEEDDPVVLLSNLWQRDPPPEEILYQTKNLQTNMGWTDDQLLRIVFASLFDKDLTIQDQKITILAMFLSSPKAPATILNCIDKLCALDNQVILSITDFLSKLLEKKVIGKEDIQKWYENPPPKMNKKVTQKVRDNAKDFVDSL